MLKQCTECKQTLIISEFHKCSRSKDGARNKCKRCRSMEIRKSYNEEDSKSRAHAQKYRRNNKKKIAVSTKKHREQNKDKLYSKTKLWKENNKDKTKKSWVEWRERNVKRRKVYKKNRRIKGLEIMSDRKQNYKKYNITIEDYDKMFDEQGGVCYICHEPSLNQRLSVDHNHETGKVRSLLCSRCNIWLGILENNGELFEQFKIYLKERS